jgi:hypothetical protein
MRKILICLSLATMMVWLAGCQTAPLAGTKWNVIEFVEPDEADRTALRTLDAMLVEFRPDGKLVTYQILEDGTAEFTDGETYHIDGEVLTIDGPDYKTVSMFRMDGENLRLHSPQFVMVMSPINRVAPKP